LRSDGLHFGGAYLWQILGFGFGPGLFRGFVAGGFQQLLVSRKVLGFEFIHLGLQFRHLLRCKPFEPLDGVLMLTCVVLPVGGLLRIRHLREGRPIGEAFLAFRRPSWRRRIGR
jgi:hypothetical protein